MPYLYYNRIVVMFYLSYYIIIFQKIIGVAASYTHTYVRSC